MTRMQYENEKERMAVLVQLEGKYYQCNDDLQHERWSIDDCTKELLCSIVQEFASVVTDKAIICNQSKHNNIRQTSNPSILLAHPPFNRNRKENDTTTNSVEYRSSPKSTIYHSSIMNNITTTKDETLTLPHNNNNKIVIKTSYNLWRTILCEWAYNVADYYDLAYETITLSIHLFDRYIAKMILIHDKHIAHDEFQLVFVTCIYLCVKVSSQYDSILSIFISLGYTQKEIVQTETHILQNLDWHINNPTIDEYCQSCLVLCDIIPDTIYNEFEQRRNILIQICTIDSFFIPCPRSILALAVTMIAIRTCSNDITFPNILLSWKTLCLVRIQDINSIHDTTGSIFFYTVYSHLEEIYKTILN